MSNRPDRAIQCECVDVRTGSIPTQAGRQPVLILDLHSDGLEFPVIKFFNAELTKSGNHTVSVDSDFAKLYRLTIGENPRKRFCEVRELLGHLLGYQFIVTAEQVLKRHGEAYLKVEKIKPVDPIYSSEWTSSGKQKGASRRRKTRRQVDDKLTTVRRQVDDKLTTVRRQVDDAKSLQAAKTLGLQPFSIPQCHYTTVQQYNSTTDPLPHVSDAGIDAVTLPAETETMTPAETEPRGLPNHSHGQTGQPERIDELNPPDDFDYYAGINQQFDEAEPMSKNTERPKPQHHVYHQRPDETRDEYWDRVINESLPDWGDK